MRTAQFLRPSILPVLSLLFVLATPGLVRAQGFISPFIGWFGGDENCPDITDCGFRMNPGVSLGVLGNVAGFEAEISYAPSFLGDTPGLESDMFVLMGNLLIAPKLGPVRPYGAIGLGLMRSTASLTNDVDVSENNNFGWSLGGGLMVFFGEHIGIRGEVRRFQSLQDIDIFGFDIEDSKISFTRLSGGLVFKF